MARKNHRNRSTPKAPIAANKEPEGLQLLLWGPEMALIVALLIAAIAFAADNVFLPVFIFLSATASVLALWRRKRFSQRYLVGYSALILAGHIALGLALHGHAQVEKSDLSLKIVGKDRPQFIGLNRTGVVMRDGKVSIWLWDMSRYPGGPLFQPLHIPVQPLDFIRPHGEMLRTDLIPQTIGLQRGDKIIGSVMSSCPDCPHSHSYLVSFVVGKGGWYALDQNPDGLQTAPTRGDPASIQWFAAMIDGTGLQHIPIQE
jgi:hypothetical protein